MSDLKVQTRCVTCVTQRKGREVEWDIWKGTVDII